MDIETLSLTEIVEVLENSVFNMVSFEVRLHLYERLAELSSEMND